MDIITLAVAKGYTNEKISELQALGPFVYKGAVENYESLPTSGRSKGDVWTTTDTGDEYLWSGSEWVKFGGNAGDVASVNGKTGAVVLDGGDINLDESAEVKETIRNVIADVKEAIESKQDKLIAGDNITIAKDGRTISGPTDLSELTATEDETLTEPLYKQASEIEYGSTTVESYLDDMAAAANVEKTGAAVGGEIARLEEVKSNKTDLLKDMMEQSTLSTSSISAIDVVSEIPSSASASGTPGQMAIDADYVYVCVSENTWKRAQLSTF